MSVSKFRRVAGLGFLPALFFCLGCSQGSHISGKVTYKGAAVANGMIYFVPDKAKGGSGQSGSAKIVNGAYDTAGQGGRPAGKGGMTVMIEGIEPAAAPDKNGEMVGKLLFPKYETTLDVTGTMTKDFDVPDAKPKAATTGGPITP